MDSSADSNKNGGGVATPSSGPVRCTGGCGFFGNSQFGGYCSMCYKKAGAPPIAEAMAEAPAITSTPASTEPVAQEPHVLSTQPAASSSEKAPSCTQSSCDDQKMEPEPAAEPTASADPTEPKKSKKKKKKKKVRCLVCRRKLRAGMQIPCRCGQMYCSLHRLPMEHSCSFDYKDAQQKKIAKNNDKISFTKLERI